MTPRHRSPVVNSRPDFDPFLGRPDYEAMISEFRVTFDHWIEILRTGAHDDLPIRPFHRDAWRSAVAAGGDRRLQLNVTCRCGKRRAAMWFVRVQSNGVRVGSLRCVVCANQIKTIGADKLGFDPPVWADGKSGVPCEVCGSTDGTEWHHWAPRHLFGDEAESWPMGALCRMCHRRWHAVVTPNMSQRIAS